MRCRHDGVGDTVRINFIVIALNVTIRSLTRSSIESWDVHLWRDESFSCNDMLNIAHRYTKHLLTGYNSLRTALSEKELE
jgi:hypothetical protein